MLTPSQNFSGLAKSHVLGSNQLSLPQVFGGYQVLCKPEWRASPVPGWQYQSGSRMGPGSLRNSTPKRLQQPQQQSSWKTQKEGNISLSNREAVKQSLQQGKAGSELCHCLASVSLESLTLMASTCPSLAELKDYRGFIWRLMALAQSIQEIHAEGSGFVE